MSTTMNLYRGLLHLEKSCPDLFFLLSNCKVEPIKVDPKAKRKMTAFAAKTKSGFRIGVNETWVEEFDTLNMAAILEHELLHIVLEHVIDTTKFKDPELANMAQDYIINDIATNFKDRSKLNKELKKGCYLEELNAKFGTHFNSTKNTSHEIYEFLLKKKEELIKQKQLIQMPASFDIGRDPSKDETQDPGEGEGQSEEVQDLLDKLAGGMGKDGEESKKEESEGKGSGKGEDESENEVSVSKGELNHNQKVVGQLNKEMDMQGLEGLEAVLGSDQIMEIIKAYSKKSSDFKQYFENIEKLNKNNMIRSAIEKFFSSNKEDFKRSIKKRNKRFSFIPYGRHPDKKQKCLVALDVSGSMMNPNDLAKIKMSVNSATGNGFLVDLIFGDTRKLGEFKDIKPNFDFNKIFGGGGTDLRFIFKGGLKDYDVVVVVTDGCFDHDDVPKNMKNRILFLITPGWGMQEVQGFKNIKI